MRTYAAVDLHSNNGVLVVIDENDRVLKERRIPNKLEQFITELEPFRPTLQGVAVESTFNWYWLVDGLREKHFPVMLVNTAATQQYEGLKKNGVRSRASCGMPWKNGVRSRARCRMCVGTTG